MVRIRVVAAAVLAMAAAAPVSCGGGNGSGGAEDDGGQANQSATAVVSGAASASETVIRVGSYDATSGDLSFGITTEAGASPMVNVAVVLPGTSLQAGTFTSADALQAAATVQLASGGVPETWLASFNESSPDQGTFNLAITDTGPMITTTNGNEGWAEAHGRFTATLTPLTGTGASGDVTLDITF